MRAFFLLLAIASVTCSCSPKVKHKLGISHTSPDETQVQTSKPLEVPPSYNLPEVK